MLHRCYAYATLGNAILLYKQKDLLYYTFHRVGESEQQHCCWLKESWARRHNSRSTSRSSYLLSVWSWHVVRDDWKEQDRGYELSLNGLYAHTSFWLEPRDTFPTLYCACWPTGNTLLTLKEPLLVSFVSPCVAKKVKKAVEFLANIEAF